MPKHLKVNSPAKIKVWQATSSAARGPRKNENKLFTQKPTPFYDAGTVPVRLASVPFENRNEPIRVQIDEPPKPALAQASSAPARG